MPRHWLETRSLRVLDDPEPRRAITNVTGGASEWQITLRGDISKANESARQDNHIAGIEVQVRPNRPDAAAVGLDP